MFYVLFFPWFAGCCDNCRELCMPVQRSRVANMRCKPPDSSTFYCVSKENAFLFWEKGFEKFNLWVLVTGNRFIL